MTGTPPVATGPLEARLAALARAIDAAATLGLDTDRARSVHADAVGRLGFTSDAYVLALVGGTGVGKSSLLNALAGAPVSRASARRPTTDAPVAWVPAAERTDLAPLLDWLGVAAVREHDDRMLPSVAILDLPDMDSMTSLHRERVEAILPRVDGVAWVTDPEKYHDAALHDDFLRSWLPRLERQALVLNKIDRVAPDDRDRIVKDLAGDLRHVPVLVVAADPPTGVTADIGTLRGWLADAIDAKAVVRARLAAAAADAASGLALAAGLDPGTEPGPLLDAAARRVATDGATRAVLRAIDLAGLERQAVAATRARARARGTGPMGAMTSLVYRLSGREMRVADPEGYLLRWRDRASLAPAVEALRLGLTTAVRASAPAIRPTLAATSDPAALRSGLERTVDGAIARGERLQVPSSRLWPLVGLLQTLTTAALALSVAWIVVWILARPAVDLVEVPVLGRIPIPLAVLVGALVVGYVLARVVGWHAGWLGRRWAGGLGRDVASAVEREIADRALAPLDALEAARRDLWTAARGATVEPRPG